jgi:hypothetical protein
MDLPGKVQSAPPGTLGFDANTTLSLQTAQKFFGQGHRFCLRYISRSTPEPAGDLSVSEATDILNAGLALMPVQHVRKAGWKPSQSLGEQDRANAALNASAIGFPPGVNVWCDLEGVDKSVVAQDVIDHCNAWFDAVSDSGYVPGLYVGADAILSGQQLFSNLKFQHYWRSQSNVPNIQRGYQLVQLFPSMTVDGVDMDVDVTQDDFRGGQAQWLAIG